MTNITATKIVLVAPVSNPALLEGFVEKCLECEVVLLCVVGDGCTQIEDKIDELIVGDGVQTNRFIVTTSHPHESQSDVIEFAENWPSERGSGYQIVRF